MLLGCAAVSGLLFGKYIFILQGQALADVDVDQQVTTQASSQVH
jgi:hypothetical protein